jgi:hypothetical protein
MVLTRAAGRTGGLRARDAVFESHSIAWKQEFVSDWCPAGRGPLYDTCNIELDSFFVERKSISRAVLLDQTLLCTVVKSTERMRCG